MIIEGISGVERGNEGHIFHFNFAPQVDHEGIPGMVPSHLKTHIFFVMV